MFTVITIAIIIIKHVPILGLRPTVNLALIPLCWPLILRVLSASALPPGSRTNDKNGTQIYNKRFWALLIS
jgi:hypothetical protein